MTPVSKYRMLVEARTDLTEGEIRMREATATNDHGPKSWPYRDTGEIIHARRRQTAVKFYTALRQINPPIKVRAVKVHEPRSQRLHDPELVRGWRGFECVSGCLVAPVESLGKVEDEVKHFAVTEDGTTTACGIKFVAAWTVNGKPECDKCLAVAVNCHPEMRQYL